MRGVGRERILAIGLDACDLSLVKSRAAQLPLLNKITESKLFCQPDYL